MNRLKRYQIITYSLGDVVPVYYKLKWWERLIGRKTYTVGYIAYAEIILCAEALSYFRPRDVILIRGVRWFVHTKNEYMVGIRTLDAIFEAPISRGDTVIKLYSSSPLK